MEYLITLIISVAINIILFIPAFFFKTDKLTDFSYGLSFFLVSLFLFLNSEKTVLGLLLFILITIWAIRLSSYLVIRISKIKKDRRFDGVRENFFKFFMFWVYQALTVWIILLPSITFWNYQNQTKISILIIGIFIWLIGLLIESIADYQKFVFVNKKENKEKWIQKGLWKYSRHPNYLGEILVWVGIYLFSISSLSTFSLALLGIISPIFIAIILIFVSGIPPLEKYADKKWRGIKEYEEYKKNTPILLPSWKKTIYHN